MRDNKTNAARPYYLGLDMGTNSVGWAVTDHQYNLIRIKGKDAWGIREFDEAKTAAERRIHRVSRRRRQREVARIGLLKSLFADAIAEVDPNFYARLDNSKYHLEDKDENVSTPNGIFNEKEYTDKDYYAEFPTVFHLRKALIENNKAYDVRLVYLACLNMFKHRGHFLNSGLSADSNGTTMAEALAAFYENLADTTGMEVYSVAPDCVESILGDRSISRTAKSEMLAERFQLDKKDADYKKKQLVMKGLTGLEIDCKVLFGLETEGKVKLAFSDFSYDEKIDDIKGKMSEEQGDLIDSMKAIYDIGSLSSILKGNQFLSFARVEDYEKHAYDLKILKKVYREFLPEKYDEMFRSDGDGTYSAYVNSSNSSRNGKQEQYRRNYKNRKWDSIKETINKDLKGIKVENDDVVYIREQLKNETFLPKQLTSANGVIPNQVHAAELRKILDNASVYLTFLNDVDESGLSVKERIEQIFSFQIPYYVGPVSEKSGRDGGNGWVVRKEAGKILPWNIDRKIDMATTSERFIERMVRECTYIRGQQVLPKASLLYEKFCVLNEINNLKIENEPITVELKQDIYNDLFTNGKKVTRRALVKYLALRGLLDNDSQLTGIDNEVKSSLSSFGKFKAVFGEEINRDSVKAEVEHIIFWCTVYGESKHFLSDKLSEEYPNITAEEKKRILGFKFRDWGNLSREFLELQGASKETGEVMSIISAMWNTNCNLMQIMDKSRFTFREELDNLVSSSTSPLDEIEYEDLEGRYFSAPVKRMVWQTLLVIREIEKYMGGAPDRVFVEMTRGDEKKGDEGRKASREKQLLDLYKSVKDDSYNWTKIIQEAGADGSIRKKKIYLYLTQMGKDMYTGLPIDLNELLTDNKFDIDHIYPRHFVKDDNINNNLVLVNKQYNAAKRDVYPLSDSIRHDPKVTELWRTLREKHLITDEKYRRLTGCNEFSEEQKAGFIARQLVETSQGTKGVAEILKEAFGDSTEIVYVKARNVSDFRNDFDLPKSRTINEFHHANDAYLNIVVGNVYFTKFTRDPKNYIRNEYRKDSTKNGYNLSKMFESDVVRGNCTAWIAAPKGVEDASIVTVRKTLSKNTPLLTRMTFEGAGELTNATLYSHNTVKAEGYYPLKSSDKNLLNVEKYGGVTSASTAFFFLVEHTEKKKRIRTIEAYSILMKGRYGDTVEGLTEYCEIVLKMKDPQVLIKRIPVKSLLKVNGYYVYLAGKTGKQLVLHNAVQLHLSEKWVKYAHLLEKMEKFEVCDTRLNANDNCQFYDELSGKFMDDIFSKRPNPVGEKLKKGREKFVNLELEEQCYVLNQILGLVIIGPTEADFSLIKEAKTVGTMKISKDISKQNSVELISCSLTGLVQYKKDLLS